jgi:hypothetical protein
MKSVKFNGENLQIKQVLTVWAMFVNLGRCWPTNNNRTNERPLDDQDNPLLIMHVLHAEEEN